MGPHFRLDKKNFEDLSLTKESVVVLTRHGCSFCEEQLKKLECFPKENVIVLFNGTEDEWKTGQRKKPNPFKNYLTTHQSLKYFKAAPVYPTALRYKDRKVLRFEGVRACQDLL